MSSGQFPAVPDKARLTTRQDQTGLNGELGLPHQEPGPSSPPAATDIGGSGELGASSRMHANPRPLSNGSWALPDATDLNKRLPLPSEEFEDLLSISRDLRSPDASKPSLAVSPSPRDAAALPGGGDQPVRRQSRQRHPSTLGASPADIQPASASKYTRGHVNVIPSPEEEVPVVKRPQTFPEVEESMYRLPIFRAIRKGDHSLVLESLRQGEDPHVVCSVTGRTFIHLVAWAATPDKELQWVPMIYQLSNVGAAVDAEDKRGETPALVAIRRKLLHVLSAILKCGAELSTMEIQEAESVRGVVRSDMLEAVRRFTPTYWQAVLDTTPFKVNRLVKAWARINVSRNGQTLLEYAKQKSHDPEVVRLLSQNEASIELAHAVMAGDCDRAGVLMCDGAVDMRTADCSVRCPSLGQLAPMSLLDWSHKLGHSHMVYLLKHYGGAGGGRGHGSPARRGGGDGAGGVGGGGGGGDTTSSVLCAIL